MGANREYKDGVFTLLFKEPERLLELYNALADSNYGADTKIEVNTLEGILFLEQMNDVSFVLDDKLIVLIEHMSTISDNLPLRLLMYIARLYEKMIEKRATYKQKMIHIPTPEFIVLYNGPVNYPEEKILRLSDAFILVPDHAENVGNLELVVRVVNINYGHNQELLRKSKSLNGYSVFIARVRENQEQGMVLKEAITEAVKYCAEKEILQPFLTQHSAEVINMLTTEFDINIAKEVWQEEALEEGIEIGRSEGMEIGRGEGIEIGMEKVLKLMQSGHTHEEIENMLSRNRQ